MSQNPSTWVKSTKLPHKSHFGKSSQMRFFWVDFHRFFVVIIVLHFPFFYRRLGDEMRSMSLEKSRQREAELAQEIERLQMEIKTLQKNSEEAANVNQQLSKEVRKKFFWHYFDDQALDLNKESSILVSIGPKITARWRLWYLSQNWNF